ncbi:hypothetical protein E5Q_05398 [Mixia osmundae IAM 14324]|uniref:Uncharacterized protein n=1 Tax=Mixia osmundae (strain CBS 9802 / IAM 14324 / JCM 22182 / KY 12970) TaxID=764103 RepID=G7E7A0_MIXOS|nr:hypothetical protein E5Q_05398 [Mixia osmundae IAM 14324]
MTATEFCNFSTDLDGQESYKKGALSLIPFIALVTPHDTHPEKLHIPRRLPR